MGARLTRLTLILVTFASAVAFLGMTVDSLRQTHTRTHSDQLSAAAVEGKRIWQQHACDDCHTIFESPHAADRQYTGARMAGSRRFRPFYGRRSLGIRTDAAANQPLDSWHPDNGISRPLCVLGSLRDAGHRSDVRHPARDNREVEE